MPTKNLQPHKQSRKPMVLAEQMPSVLPAVQRTHSALAAEQTLYLSASFASFAQRLFNRQLGEALEAQAFTVILPQERFEQFESKHIPSISGNVFSQFRSKFVIEADLAVFLADGADSGVGTEFGIRHASGKPLLVVWSSEWGRDMVCAYGRMMFDLVKSSLLCREQSVPTMAQQIAKEGRILLRCR